MNEIIDQAEIDERTKQLLKEAAERQSAKEQASIPFISLKGKKFAVGDEKLGTKLAVVILANIFDNSYYDRPYDPNSDEVFPPACFAIYNDVLEAAPHENSPAKQSDSCAECVLNEFGSAKQGKGKACRNGRRILVASVTNGEVNLSDLSIINMSPTALKGFSRYAKSINITIQLPLWAVITELSFDEESAYPVLIANFVSHLNTSDVNKIVARFEEFEELVAVPYDTSNYEALIVAPEDSTKKKSKMS